jgi:hypothetical protein
MGFWTMVSIDSILLLRDAWTTDFPLSWRQMADCRHVEGIEQYMLLAISKLLRSIQTVVMFAVVCHVLLKSGTSITSPHIEYAALSQSLLAIDPMS